MAHICVVIDNDMHIIVDKDVRCQYILIAGIGFSPAHKEHLDKWYFSWNMTHPSVLVIRSSVIAAVAIHPFSTEILVEAI